MFYSHITSKLFTYILQVSCEFHSHPFVYSGTLKQKCLSSNGSEGNQALDGSEGKSVTGWKRGKTNRWMEVRGSKGDQSQDGNEGNKSLDGSEG